MATINKFEDLEIWKLARSLSSKIYALTLTAKFSTEYKFKEQIKASSGSIMYNIAEGFERDGNKEFINFLAIAKGSAGEVKSQLYRSSDLKMITSAEFEECYNDADHLSKKIGAFIQYLKNVNIKGHKFKY